MNNKCHFCNEEATVRLVRIDDRGQMTEIFLCPKHKPENWEARYDFCENAAGRQLDVALSHHFCPVCGCSKTWVEEHKHLGCPKCYEVFSDFVKPYLKGFKDCSVYLGKVPQPNEFSSFSTLEEAYKPRVEYWEECKEKFIKSENFEAAQGYQRQIDILKKELEDASVDI